MKCPVCPTRELVMTDRSGIEIDYCPSCRGVWLDRGELDKIIERSLTDPQASQAPQRGNPPLYGAQPQQQPPQGPFGGTYTQGRKPDDSDIYPAQGGTYPPHKKRKSWLSDLFD